MQFNSRNRYRLLRVAVTVLLFAAPAFAQTSNARAERELFASINQARVAQGLPALRWDDALASAARRHAEVMAQKGSAQHSFEGEAALATRVKQAGAHFTWLSENVALAPTASLVHTQFMNSPNHRANILDSDMDSIGIGIVERNGQLFTVEDFAKVR